MMYSTKLLNKTRELLQACRIAGIKIASAESCTGGLITGCLTEIPGASDVVERGFVCYTNIAKVEQLGVSAEMIHEHGAVSHEVAREMVNGALRFSQASLAVSVTGIAGPGGGTLEKPIGLVYIGTALKSNRTTIERHVFNGDRQTVRELSVETALDLMLLRLQP